MSEKKTRCANAHKKDQKDNSGEPPAESESKKWENITNNSTFMEALISFMNESWFAVSQVRQQYGLPAGDKTAVNMTEEEREAKIKEILFKLQDKYKELSELEAQLNQVSGKPTPEDVAAENTNQMTCPQHNAFRPMPPPTQGRPLMIPGTSPYPQEQSQYCSYYPSDGTVDGYQSPYMSGDYMSQAAPTPPPRRKLQFGGEISSPPPAPETTPGDAFQPYQDSESEYGTEGGTEGQYCSESGATTASSVASVPEPELPEYQGSSGASSAPSSAPSSAGAKRAALEHYQQLQRAALASRRAYLASLPVAEPPGSMRLSMPHQYATPQQNYPIPPAGWTTPAARRIMQYQPRRSIAPPISIQGGPPLPGSRRYLGGDPCDNDNNYTY